MLIKIDKLSWYKDIEMQSHNLVQLDKYFLKTDKLCPTPMILWGFGTDSYDIFTKFAHHIL